MLKIVFLDLATNSSGQPGGSDTHKSPRSNKIGVMVTVNEWAESVRMTVWFGKVDGGLGRFGSPLSGLQPFGGCRVPSSCARNGVAAESGHVLWGPRPFCELGRSGMCLACTKEVATSKKRRREKPIFLEPTNDSMARQG